MFQVGDRVILATHDTESMRNNIPLGSEGEIAFIDTTFLRIVWDNPGVLDYISHTEWSWEVAPKYTNKRMYGVFPHSVRLSTEEQTPYSNICRKIKHMEQRWNKFQQGKQQCVA